MIALLKLFKKQKIKDGITVEVAGAQPFAIYNKGILEILDQQELMQIFLNNGKVFVTEAYQLPEKEIYRLFELSEMSNFDITRPTSMKYKLGKEIYDVNLYEVIDLDESIDSDKTKIVEKLTNGIYIPFSVTSQILFRTKDDYLIGPVQMQFENGLYVIKNSKLNFLPYYQQEVDIVAIFDEYKNQERLFCTNNLEQNNIIGWIDVADEQRVIIDALKQLKDNAEFGDLSRKMIARLKEWYESDGSRQLHIKERLQRAIQIMQSNTLDTDTVKLFSKLLLDLDITMEIIKEQTEQKFNGEYEKFIKQNEQLIKSYEKQKMELHSLEERYIKISRACEQAELNYQSLEKNMKKKIKQLQNNFSDVYAEQLALSGYSYLPSSTMISHSSKTLQGFVQYQSSAGIKIKDFSDFDKILQESLSSFKGEGSINVLAAIIFSAILLEEPIIIYGDYSYELAQCIAKTITCEETLSVIPEIDHFSLDELNQQFTNYSKMSDVKSLIIHNPHTTTGLYSLPAYLKQNKWISNEFAPNLIIITIDSLEEAETFIEKMLYKPLINSNDYMKRSMNKQNIKLIQPGQMVLEVANELALEEYSIGIRRDFREWIEDTFDEDLKVSYQLVEWLNQLGTFLDKDVLFQETYKIFANSIKLNGKSKHEVGVN